MINKLKSKDIPLPLGRWKLDNCNTKINNKVDLSNEDHCGPCGQYVLEKVKLNNDIKIDNKIDIKIDNKIDNKIDKILTNFK